MNRKGRLFRLLAVSIAIILNLGIWLGYGGDAQAARSLSSPGGAVFVSKQAPAMISIFASPERIEGLIKIGDFSPLKKSFLKNTGIDYRQDIQPWMGEEITLAVTTLDIDRDASNGETPGYLMVLRTKDGEKSREFLQLLFSQRVLAGGNLTTDEFAGVKIVADSTLENKNQLAGAIVANQYVLFANNRKVLREAINNVQAPDLNLPSSQEYQTAIAQIDKDSLGIAYFNLDAIAQWQGLNLPVKNYHSQIISFNLDSPGLIAETAAVATKELPTPTVQITKPVTALGYIPNTASITVAGKDLSSLDSSNLALFWQQLVAALSGKQDVGIDQIVQPLAELQTQAGINLKTDIFSWVQGEYAMGLFPKANPANPDWVLVVEKSPTVTAGIEKLNEIAKQRNLTISSFSLLSQPVTAWTQLITQRNQTGKKSQFTIETTALAVSTTIDNYEIFASSLEAMQAVLSSKKTSMLDNRRFQKNIANLPTPNQGLIYIDWNSSQTILAQQIPILKLAKIIAKPLFEQLHSLTISSYDSNSQVLKGGIYLEQE